MTPDHEPPQLPRPIPLPVAVLPEGWRCPDCRHVYGPQVTECSRCPQQTLGDRLRSAAGRPIRFPTVRYEPREGDIR